MRYFGRRAKAAKKKHVPAPLLGNYFGTYAPKKYFIEGEGGNQYSAASVRAFLKQSCKRAGIKKRITQRTLRHSFATHLMENGVGIRHIQELLGHAKPETTLIYTHIAQKDLLSIRSPLDLAVNKFLNADKKQENFMLSGNFKG
ncbi:tyrosine-type recombinase/integrase [Pricia sp.]|uniref:tyrosine-type recombinase/integrase n=1 Tax=Pricia sp. TaxID=2268138 RepID=UPI0035933687